MRKSTSGDASVLPDKVNAFLRHFQNSTDFPVSEKNRRISMITNFKVT